MDYEESYEALNDIVDKDGFEELVDELSGTGTASPEVQELGDRAILYLQVSEDFSQDFQRIALAEYRDGEYNPVPFEAGELEGLLDGRGEVDIDETLVEKRDINYSQQRHRV